ncbi:MAG: Hsp20/alpha crystallin family protein [Planctomycetaceae bacterium]
MPNDPDIKSSDDSGKPEPQRYVFTPPIDIYETDEGLVLQADLPGVTVETLELQVQDNKLTLFGRVSAQVDSDAQTIHREYNVGDFLRSFILSDDVDHNRIRANLNRGVLRIVLPKAAQAEPRRIDVSAD